MACLGMAPAHGVYVTHVRYARGTLEGVREAVEIGRRAGVPVHISHLKGATEAETEAIIDYIDLVAINEVDFSFDVYPYMSSSTMLQYLLPPEVWRDGILAAYGKLGDPVLRDRFQRRLDAMNLASIMLAWLPGRRNADFLGSSLADYVTATGRRPADALCDLLLEEGMAVLLVFHQEENGLESAFLEHPCYMMGSDGIYFPDGAIHPRYYGSAARLLGHYVRRKRSLTVEEAVYKLSGNPARRFKLRDRGVLRVGAHADLVVFDPDTVGDRATFDHPYRPAQGVSHVVVNGTVILADRVPVAGALPGRYLRYGK
jgi:N-acyl-D-amino-acid deacylase